MLRKSILLFTLILLGGLFFFPLNAATIRETFKKKIDFSPGGYISVKNTNGSITIEGWDRDEVMIEALKKVNASSRKYAERYMDEIVIEIEQDSKEIFITTHLPRKKGGGLFSWLIGNHVSGSVQYKLRIPEQTDVRVRTTNGAVNLEQVAGRLNLKTTNGKILANQVSGQIEAKTTNGSVKVHFDKIDRDSDMGFYTTNGSIRLYLPEDIHCTVRARTTNGSINTDFPLRVKGKYNSKRLQGEINGGGGLLELKTTNGSIHLYQK